MRNRQLSPDDIQAIRHRVSQLAQTSQPAPPLPPASMPLPNPVPTPVASTYSVAPPPSQPSSDIQSLLSSNTLADILASAARAKQVPPVPSAPLSVPPSQYRPETASQASPTPTSTPSTNTTSLLANLRALGMLKPHASTSNGAVPAPQASPFYPPTHLVNPSTPSMQAAHPARLPLAEVLNDVQLTNASLKMYVTSEVP